jgi:hypothetical protein
MPLSHRHGWPTVEDAERSKVYTTNPGATIVTDCRYCDKVHVDLPEADGARDAPRRALSVRKPTAGPPGLTREAS